MNGILKFFALGVLAYLLIMAWGLAIGFSNHFPAQEAVDSLEALAAQMEAVNTIPTLNVSPDELDRLWGECPVGKPGDVIRKLPDLPLTEHALAHDQQIDPLEDLEDPVHGRGLGLLPDLVEHGFSGFRQLQPQFALRQGINQQGHNRARRVILVES
jgi:hypothetical protein